jgi:hypothetical protein
MASDARIGPTTPVWFPALVWLAYGLGAAVAGATYRWWPSAAQALGVGDDLPWWPAALAGPILIVAVVILIVTGKWWRRRAASA